MIIDSQPLTVALLASVLFGERLGALGFLGLGLGVVGLCFLEVPVEALQGELLQTWTWAQRPGQARNLHWFLACPTSLSIATGDEMPLSAAIPPSSGGSVCKVCMESTLYTFNVVPVRFRVRRSGQRRVCMRTLQVH